MIASTAFDYTQHSASLSYKLSNPKPFLFSFKALALVSQCTLATAKPMQAFLFVKQMSFRISQGKDRWLFQKKHFQNNKKRSPNAFLLGLKHTKLLRQHDQRKMLQKIHMKYENTRFIGYFVQSSTPLMSQVVIANQCFQVQEQEQIQISFTCQQIKTKMIRASEQNREHWEGESNRPGSWSGVSQIYWHFSSWSYNIFDQPRSSMEVPLVLPQQPASPPPCKPLQGYFRFRQQMMAKLEQDKRNSQNIVELWNNLTPGQRAALNCQDQLLTAARLSQLPTQHRLQQIPLQPLSGTIERSVAAGVLGQIVNLTAESCKNDEQSKGTVAPKKKMIKKVSQLAQSKRNQK